MKKNSELKVGDRVWLVYMLGETFSDMEGVVTSIGQSPKDKPEDSGIMYNMKWYDDDGKVVSTLSLIPETDKWVKLND